MSREDSQFARCGNDVPGDTYRGLQVSNAFYSESFKHALLPIWFLSYRFRKKLYRVLVNGQTGEVEGEAPLSVVKILLLIVLIAAVGGIIFLLSSNRSV